MINDMCEEHPNKKIIYMCLYNDTCRKKLCEICYQSHEQITSQPSRIIKIEWITHKSTVKNIEKEFVQMLEQKQNLNKFKLNQIIEQVIKFFEELKMIKRFKMDNDEYLDVTENEFQIKNMLEQKKTILIIINQILLTQQEILKINNQVDMQSLIYSTYQENYNNTILQGPTIFGFLHGKYVRIIDGVQKQGYNMQLSQIIGKWRKYGIKTKKIQNQMSIQIEQNEEEISYIKDGQIQKIV